MANIIGKKAQEEMVGLVLIILVVSVIFLLFLGLSLSQSNSERRVESSEATQFLDASLEYTTSCSTNGGYSYLKLKELISRCNQNSADICENGEKICEVAESTFKELIESTWVFSVESKTTGYETSIVFKDSTTQTSTPLTDFEAPKIDCISENRRGAEKPISTQAGTIVITLELC